MKTKAKKPAHTKPTQVTLNLPIIFEVRGGFDDVTLIDDFLQALNPNPPIKSTMFVDDWFLMIHTGDINSPENKKVLSAAKKKVAAHIKKLDKD